MSITDLRATRQVLAEAVWAVCCFRAIPSLTSHWSLQAEAMVHMWPGRQRAAAVPAWGKVLTNWRPVDLGGRNQKLCVDQLFTELFHTCPSEMKRRRDRKNPINLHTRAFLNNNEFFPPPPPHTHTFCLICFLTSSSTTRLALSRMGPKTDVWQFYVLPNTKQSWETMTSVSAGHIILTNQ